MSPELPYRRQSIAAHSHSNIFLQVAAVLLSRPQSVFLPIMAVARHKRWVQSMPLKHTGCEGQLCK